MLIYILPYGDCISLTAVWSNIFEEVIVLFDLEDFV